MKILPVSLLNYNKTATEQRPIPENNRNSYFRFRNPGLLGLPHDTCTFSGKIASIVTPTMEDLINKTKASDIVRSNILRLAKYKIPCPCCGHIMLDLDRYNKFEQKVMSTTTPKTLLKFISELGAYLHPVEAKVLDMMKSVHYTNPDMTLQDILRSKLKRSEKKLIMQQSKTFVTLGMLSRKLPQDTGEEVKGLINETYDRLFDQRETSRFSRKVFIGKLEAILDKVKDDSLKSEFIQEAVKQQWLIEEEIGIYKRGRNAKSRHVPKNTSVMTYNQSTGFETLVGHLYLLKKQERITEIFDLFKEFVDGK